VVKEFNEIMALDPAIKTSKRNVAQLTADIREAAAELRNDDEFSDDVEDTLVIMGIRSIPLEEAGAEEATTEEVTAGEEGEEAAEETDEPPNWLKGCEVCNIGLVSKIEEEQKSGVSLNKACKEMVKEMEAVLKISPYTANALKQRYLYYKGGGKDTESKKAKGKAGEFTLKSVENAIKKTADLLKQVPKTKKFKTSEEGKSFIEFIRQYGQDIMAVFKQLEIDS
jgi:hypothetical protein